MSGSRKKIQFESLVSKEVTASRYQSPVVLGKMAAVLLETAGEDAPGHSFSGMKDLAHYLQTTPQTAFDALNELHEKGFIRMERGRVLILDRNNLKDIAVEV